MLEQMRDNPNTKLHEMATEVELLSRKIDPILKRVEEAQQTIKRTGLHYRLSEQPGPVGMLSKMGGRLIAFYADDLAELMFEDFLSETVKDLQDIEGRTRSKFSDQETNKIAADILDVIKEYQIEENHVDTKWGNKRVQTHINSQVNSEQSPAQIEVDFEKNDDTPIITTKKYENPFQLDKRGPSVIQSSPITVPEKQEDTGYIKRKWKCEVDGQTISSISKSRESFIAYLKRHNGTANQEVWKVYDHLAADIFNEVMRELMGKIDKDLDQYCEKIIYDEFQLE